MHYIVFDVKERWMIILKVHSPHQALGLLNSNICNSCLNSAIFKIGSAPQAFTTWIPLPGPLVRKSEDVRISANSLSFNFKPLAF